MELLNQSTNKLSCRRNLEVAKPHFIDNFAVSITIESSKMSQSNSYPTLYGIRYKFMYEFYEKTSKIFNVNDKDRPEV